MTLNGKAINLLTHQRPSNAYDGRAGRLRSSFALAVKGHLLSCHLMSLSTVYSDRILTYIVECELTKIGDLTAEFAELTK
jgi:hypothetical protein